ncbi:uncharacterized protein PAC_06143 [Phialocephala subalpina]|uniref:Glycoside hydrolase family 31 TIM barrel domain-containing protein n=1 Tax=Phialocephala subalpina TaxID=576137 RepID=A0A1L7WTZ7_9HELO|nr:uncharacterized protein PAC_06143 [Phialocephala subalpina]
MDRHVPQAVQATNDHLAWLRLDIQNGFGLDTTTPLCLNIALTIIEEVSSCPGCTASSVQTSDTGISADLSLAGSCNAYGTNLQNLRMTVNYQTKRQVVHVKIYDPEEQVYHRLESDIRNSVPTSANVSSAGSCAVWAGQDADPLMLNTANYTRTLWSRDAGGVPPGTNIYGNHPVYFEDRPASNSSNGVAFINSSGMDIKINNTEKDGHCKAATMTYWGFGLHNYRFGYANVFEVAEAVANYSAANIPLETMWTDIMRKLVAYLHDHDQHYVVMVDPAVAYQNYNAFNNGAALDVFLKTPMVPGTMGWFGRERRSFRTSSKRIHRHSGMANSTLSSTSRQVSASMLSGSMWMNLLTSVFGHAITLDHSFISEIDPPSDNISEPTQSVPGVPPDFQPSYCQEKRQDSGSTKGLSGRDLNPQYMINNAGGSLSNHTVFTNLIRANGLAEYGTHNISSLSSQVRHYDVRRLTHRHAFPSPYRLSSHRDSHTFIGAGTLVTHWLGDNISSWDEYIQSIRHLLQFSSIFQVSIVGAGVCGFIDNTTETLCARQATLGAFYTFFRNHNVAEAARGAIDTRYKLLGYIYTGFHKQTVDGTRSNFPKTPTLSPSKHNSSTPVPLSTAGQLTTLTNINFTSIPVHILGGSIIPMRVSGANTTIALRKLDFEVLVAPDENGMASEELYLDEEKNYSRDHFFMGWREGDVDSGWDIRL